MTILGFGKIVLLDWEREGLASKGSPGSTVVGDDGLDQSLILPPGKILPDLTIEDHDELTTRDHTSFGVPDSLVR